MKRFAMPVVLLGLIVFAVLGMRERNARRDAAGEITVSPGFGEEADRAPEREIEPRAVGEQWQVRVFQEPATHFGAPQQSSEDEHLREVAEGIAGVRYDPGLAFVAREIAMFHVDAGELPPGNALAFFVESAGASCWGSRQLIVETSKSGDGPLRDAVKSAVQGEAPAGSGQMRVGLGETIGFSKPARRHIAVVVSRCGVDLDPVSRVALVDSTITLTGAVNGQVAALDVLAMGADLQVREAQTQYDGRRFSAQIPVGPAPGPLDVELVARTAAGPVVLAQLTFRVRLPEDEEAPLPDSVDAIEPPDESEVATGADAEALMYDLVTLDRRYFGLDDVTRDPELDRVARAHSLDMRDNGFFAHTSPTTGEVADRLATVGIRTSIAAENIARNGTVAAAEAGLMRSIGHRRNILSAEVDRVGIGIVRGENPTSDSPDWHVTQVFARRSERLDPAAIRVAVTDQIALAREGSGHPQLRHDGRLEKIAQREAELMEAASPKGALQGDKRAFRGASSAYTATLGDLGQYEAPAAVAEARFARVGIGAVQDWDGGGRIYIVVIFSGP